MAYLYVAGCHGRELFWIL